DAGTSDKVATNRGFVFIPEKGDQVMVAFRYDDPNRPFVLGSLFHGKSGTGGGSSNKTKSLTTRSGCTITLDDEKGSVMMKDKEGNSYTADGEGNITISASKSITLCVGENKIMIDSEGNISSNAEKDITESA
ncbi:phage baseplate assembly protein V, partial [Phocaeicola vulgatus]